MKPPSGKLFKSVLGVISPKTYAELVERESSEDRARIITQELARAEVRYAETGKPKHRRKAQRMRTLRQEAIALLQLDISGAEPNPLDPDFRELFISRSGDVTRDDLQKFMAKLLAEEVTDPGSMSKRAINAVADLSIEEAKAFSNLCQFNWHVGGLTWPIVHDLNLDQINLFAVELLQSIGLVSEKTTGYILNLTAGNPVMFSYGDRVAVLRSDSPVAVRMGRVRLTPVGEQLAGLVDFNPVEGLFETCLNKWRGQKVEVYEDNDFAEMARHTEKQNPA